MNGSRNGRRENQAPGRGVLKVVERKTHIKRSRKGRSPGAILITGGAGFIGTNLASRLLSSGRKVIVYDNLSRPGVERNLDWLVHKHRDLLQVEVSDIRDTEALNRAVAQASHVFHLAAQVAVTSSLVNPIEDFEINARGTLNLLEAVRNQKDPPFLLFTSTNKVYGALEDVPLIRDGGRYVPTAKAIAARGIDESRPVAFHSPYGCSKGAADQYVLDYARTFKLPAVVFRMSCIYGPHQFGTEDQGWVAHFLIRAIENKRITLYGDGLQVRDILYVDDLVNAFLLAEENISLVAGKAFNIGGGPANTVSLLELVDLIREISGERCRVQFAGWRHADQRYYVSNTSGLSEATGWEARVGVRQGVGNLHNWLVRTSGKQHSLLARSQSQAENNAALREAVASRG